MREPDGRPWCSGGVELTSHVSESDPRAAEAQLIDRIRAGDTQAYAALVAAHAGLATRLAVLNGAGSDADDVVQEAFVKAYVALGGFRSGTAFRPWLMRIVINETRNAIRARQRRLQRDDRAHRLADSGVWQPGPEALAELSERQRTLIGALARLPDSYRDVVACRYLLEMSEAETAMTLDLAAGTVKSRLHRALRALREELA